MNYKVGQLADFVQGKIKGNPGLEIKGVSGIKNAGEGDITFFSDKRYQHFLETTGASAVLVPEIDLSLNSHNGKTFIMVPDPHRAFMEIVALYAKKRSDYNSGIHPSAIIGERVKLGKEIYIGPNVVVENDVVIGDKSIIMAGVFVGESTLMGRECKIYPNVSIMDNVTIGDKVVIHAGSVIGSDGFGFSPDGNINKKVPQLGTVEIGDNVEIGASVTVDRATFGKTVVGEGTKIDNLVQIGHNVVVGKNSILCAQVGISGSTIIGESVILAGQAGVVGHITIGNRVVVGAQAGVTKPIKEGETVSGYPARPHRKALRSLAEIGRISILEKKIKLLENQLNEIIDPEAT